jgi:hypothetical protein
VFPGAFVVSLCNNSAEGCHPALGHGDRYNGAGRTCTAAAAALRAFDWNSSAGVARLTAGCCRASGRGG